MLLRFSIENWMSFCNQATFSMIASQERQHGERIPTLKKFQSRILPIAAIYGGNASGKTNFFKALYFIKKLVTEGTQPDNLIPVETFLLDTKKTTSPTCFVLELLIDEIIYEFSFTTTQKAILEEKLVKINSASEKILYHRKNNNIHFDKAFQKDQFLQFAFKGTRDNQLFLTNSVSQKVENFKPIYDWFKDNLELVAPDSRFGPFEQFIDENHHSYKMKNKMLSSLDTGISRLGVEEMPFENIPVPALLKTQIQTTVKEGMTIRLATSMNERFIVTRKNDTLIAKKLVAYHVGSDGKEVKFDIPQESDGSQRTIDLLPAFLELSEKSSKKVYIIDEVDRSLHTLLTRSLIEHYLNSCSTETRKQLLFTTHDVLLMDQNLLRRDEMWVAERNNQGISELISFSEYQDIRYDKDIRKSYLQGRLGGIPRILLEGNL